MKRTVLLLCLALLLPLAGCGGGGSASSPADGPEEPVASSEAITQPAATPPATEPPAKTPTEAPSTEPAASQASSAPGEPADPYPDAPLVIAVIDGTGKPVPYLTGILELGLATENSVPSGEPMAGPTEAQRYTDETGRLWYLGSPESLPERGTLILRAFHDDTVSFPIPVTIPADRRELTVVWPGGEPPREPVEPAEEQRITIRVVDRSGKPVANVRGGLEQRDAASVSYRSLFGDSEDGIATGENGCLYLELESGWADESSRTYELLLRGLYDHKLEQRQTLELPDGPGELEVVWSQSPPPAEKPPQSTGLRITIVDGDGSPVSGVELSGSPYPKETTGDVPDITMLLGPSDETGYIRWDDTSPGTYVLHGRKGDVAYKYEVRMPADKVMADVILRWRS